MSKVCECRIAGTDELGFTMWEETCDDYNSFEKFVNKCYAGFDRTTAVIVTPVGAPESNSKTHFLHYGGFHRDRPLDRDKILKMWNK